MNIEHELTLAHLNLRREKEGENAGPVAADVKLVGKDVPLAACAGLFSTKTGFEAALGKLYRKDNEMVTVDIESIRLAREGVGIHASLTTVVGNVTLTFAGAQFNKITITPKPGRVVDIAARLQVRPTHEQAAMLAELLENTLRVKIAQAQGNLPLEAGNQPPADGDAGDEQPQDEQEGDGEATDTDLDEQGQFRPERAGDAPASPDAATERTEDAPGDDFEPRKPLSVATSTESAGETP